MADQPLTLAVFEEFERRLFGRLDGIDSRLGGHDGKLDGIDGSLDSIDGRLGGHDQKFVAIAGQFDRVARRFDATDRRFDELDARIDARFDQASGQFDAVLHRLLALEDEVTLIKEGLARVERETKGLGTSVLRLDERLSRVEKRLDDLVAAEPRYALRAEVQ